MRNKLVALVFFFLLVTPIVRAQEVNSDFQKAKLQIWCETTKFIFQDNGADTLVSTLNCSSTDAFEQSIRSNPLQTKTFYNSIEKPSVYEGFSTKEAKLGKLISEITKKLKSSPQRAGDSTRIKGVDSLELVLNRIVSGAEVSNENNVVVDTDLPVEEVESEEVMPVATNQSGKSWNWSEIFQWALIIGLVALCGYLWKELIGVRKLYGGKLRSRKEEIRALEQRLEEMYELLNKRNGGGVTEEKVKAMIRSELSSSRTPTSAPKGPRVVTALKPQNLPKPKEEEPPVEERKLEVGEVYFDKIPFDGGFHQESLATQPARDSIYTIKVSDRNPEEAFFWVTENAEIQKYALQNGINFFEEACDFDLKEENPKRVINIQRGLLRKKGKVWQIQEKARISFE